MKRYKVVTLGCRTNQYESQAFCDQLKRNGYIEATDNDEIDIVIINTCSVTKSADNRSLYQVRKYAKIRPEVLIVTGCFSEQCKGITGVTHVISNFDKEKLLSIVFQNEKWSKFSIDGFHHHTRAFVKIQDGCNSYCSYCIIPFVRGKSRSKKIDDIVEEVKLLVENGYKEVVLTGINVGDFDGGVMDRSIKISDLIYVLGKIDGLKRIRISSIDPDMVDYDLIEAIKNVDKVCNSMHLSLQSGSNVILKKMRRRYTKQQFLNKVREFLKIDIDFTFSTDVIIGFPGETESDFRETLEVIKDVGFIKVHSFPYSDRLNTRSSLMADKVSRETLKERKERLIDLSEKKSFYVREKYVGEEVDVLLETRGRGYTKNLLPVFINSNGERPGEIVRVRCLSNKKHGLFGENEYKIQGTIQTIFN